MGGTDRNYLIPYQDGVAIDLVFSMDTNNKAAVAQTFSVPKIIFDVHDCWTNYQNIPNSPLRKYNAHEWKCDLAFVRDLNKNNFGNSEFPVFPFDFAIENRYIDACKNHIIPINERPFDIAFFGSYLTAGRKVLLDKLVDVFKCDFGTQYQYVSPDTYWSKWVNGRFTHNPEYFKRLCLAKTVFSPWGAGPSCGRTYEALAAQAIPLIQECPKEIIQMNGFIDGENCILWSSIEELINKLDEILNDTMKLTRLLDKSQTFAREKCLTKHRAEYVLSILKAHNIL